MGACSASSSVASGSAAVFRSAASESSAGAGWVAGAGSARAAGGGEATVHMERAHPTAKNRTRAVVCPPPALRIGRVMPPSIHPAVREGRIARRAGIASRLDGRRTPDAGGMPAPEWLAASAVEYFGHPAEMPYAPTGVLRLHVRPARP